MNPRAPLTPRAPASARPTVPPRAESRPPSAGESPAEIPETPPERVSGEIPGVRTPRAPREKPAPPPPPPREKPAPIAPPPPAPREVEKEAPSPGIPGRALAVGCKNCQKVTRKRTPYCDFCGRPLPNLEGSVLLGYRWSGGRTPDGTPAIYVTCTVRPSIRFLSGTPVRNLGFLIDMSTLRRESETSARLHSVQRILDHVVDELTPQDFLTVAFFGRRPYLFLAGEKLDESKSVRRLMQKKLENIDLGEGRMLAEGIEQVSRELRRHFSQEKINRVVIVTDGPCLDTEEALQACRNETEGGVQFSVITLREGPWNAYLENLAHAGNGKAYPGIETRHIPEILSQELMTVRPTYTTQVELFFHVDPGWSVTRAFKISPVIVDLGSRSADQRLLSVKLTDLQIYDDQTLLLEICPVAVDPRRRTIATAELVCDFPRDDVKNMSFTLPLQVPAPAEACNQENEEVLRTVRMIMSVFGRTSPPKPPGEAG